MYKRRRPVRQEVKTVDIPTTLYGPTSAATGVLLNGVNEGPAFYERIGRDISMKSLHFHLEFYPNAAAVSTGIQPVSCRILLVYDRQTNGAAPAFADVVESIDAAGNGTSQHLDYPAAKNFNRFRILLNDVVFLPSIGTSGVAGTGPFNGAGPMDGRKDTSYNYDRYIKLKGMKADFIGSTPAIGDFGSGSIYFFARTGFAGATYNINYNARLRYYD